MMGQKIDRGTRAVKPSKIKILNCLQMLSSGNSAKRSDEIAYMAEETGIQYFSIMQTHN